MAILTILREDYLKLMMQVAPALSKTHVYCSAKLIHLFNWITKEGQTPVTIRRKDIHSKLLGEHGKDAIAKGIEVLQELGLLRLEINNRDVEAGGNGENGQIKTYRYYFNGGVLTSLLQKGGLDKLSTPKKNKRRSTQKSNRSGDYSPSYIDPFLDPFLKTPPPTPQEEEGFEKKDGPEDGLDSKQVSQDLSEKQVVEECCSINQQEVVLCVAMDNQTDAELNKDTYAGLELQPSAISTNQGLEGLKEVISSGAAEDTKPQEQQDTVVEEQKRRVLQFLDSLNVPERRARPMRRGEIEERIEDALKDHPQLLSLLVNFRVPLRDEKVAEAIASAHPQHVSTVMAQMSEMSDIRSPKGLFLTLLKKEALKPVVEGSRHRVYTEADFQYEDPTEEQKEEIKKIQQQMMRKLVNARKKEGFRSNRFTVDEETKVTQLAEINELLEGENFRDFVIQRRAQRFVQTNIEYKAEYEPNNQKRIITFIYKIDLGEEEE